jgi:Rrf2 family protein
MSQGVEWALHCVVNLSYLEPGRSGSRTRLAEYYGLPDAYLAKHLKSLVRAGLLVASTGPQGGFRLARAPEEITVLEVVEAIEGAGPSFLCTEIRQHGVCAAPPSACRSACPVAKVMYAADAAWRDSLRQVTIADLGRRVPKTYQKRGADWMRGTLVRP